MTYKEAVARLYSLELTGIKLGLENITDFCERLGDPQSQFISVHIAGTNGKGSVTALLSEMLRQAGWRVGRYTSPHLRDFRERIEIDGHPVGRQVVTRFVERHWPLIQRQRYSYFEVVTALAFDVFKRADVQIGVIEVGLGGRFDATNILSPALSIITQIDYDHERILGRTLRKIAFEKAGIIKPGAPVLTGPLPPEATTVMDRISRRRGAPLFDAATVLLDRHRPRQAALKSTKWRTPLLGTHQFANLGIALAACVLLQGSGIPIGSAAQRIGARRVRWPGRFQVQTGNPVTVFDVAHNPSGARAFARTWKDVFGSGRAVIVYTTKEDKGYSEMWGSLAPLASRWIGCPLPHTTGIPQDEMKRLAHRTGTPFEWTDTAEEAMQIARRHAGRTGVVAVVGSHYLVGDLIPAALVHPTVNPRETLQTGTWERILTSLRGEEGR